MIRNVNTDLVAGILGLAMSAAFWWLIDPQTTFLSTDFPKAVILLMAIISGILVVKGFGQAAERANLFEVGNNRRVVVTGFLFFGWAISISYLGFFVASVSAITLIALYLALARRRVSVPVFLAWVLIITCIVTAFYLVFNRLLHIQLPEGWFF